MQDCLKYNILPSSSQLPIVLRSIPFLTSGFKLKSIKIKSKVFVIKEGVEVDQRIKNNSAKYHQQKQCVNGCLEILPPLANYEALQGLTSDLFMYLLIRLLIRDFAIITQKAKKNK